MTGFYKPNSRFNRVTRIWSTKELIKQFKQVKFQPYHIQNHIERESIILRNSAKKDIKYDDNPDIKRMRSILIEYNQLISRTFIDIPELDEPLIITKDKYIAVSSNEKFTRRIFNNETWDDGGKEFLPNGEQRYI